MKYANYILIALQIKSTSLAVIGSACDFRYGWIDHFSLSRRQIYYYDSMSR